MTRLVYAATVVLLSGVIVAAQGVSGGAGQTSTPQPGARGQRPGAPVVRDPAAEAARTGTGRIRGRVVAADTAAPVRRAQVNLIGQGRSRSMTTDVDGRYEFGELPAGSYTVMASKAGFITAQNGQRRPNMPGQPVVVADGQVRSQVDVALPRGGVVTGRISDEFGEPLAGAQIQVQRYTYGPNGRQLQFAGSGPGGMTTDDLGQFRIYGLAAGDYVVSARVQQNLVVSPNQDDRSEGYPPTYYPGTSNLAEAQMVTVTAAQETPVQFGLIATRLARLSGRVIDGQGRPAAGAMVQLSSGGPTSGMTMGAGQVQPDGSFTIVRVPPGDHVIRVNPRPQNMGPNTFVLSTGDASGNDPEVGTLPISVAGDDMSGLTIQMRRAARLSGRLVFEGTASRPNLQQMRVSVQAVEQQGIVTSNQLFIGNGGSPLQNGQPDADGMFELRGVVGRVLLRVASPSPWQLKAVTLRGEDMTDTLLDVTDDLEGLRIVLTDRMTQVSGTVTGDRAQGEDGVAIIVLPREEREGLAGQRYTRAVRQLRADRYQINGLPAGDYVAAAFAWLEPGSEWDPRVREAIRESGEAFSLTEGQQRSLALRISADPGQ